MATTPPPSGGGVPLGFWVYAIAYPAAPSTSVPYIVANPLPGTNALAGPLPTYAAAVAWVVKHPQYFGKGKTNIAPPADVPVSPVIPGIPGTYPTGGQGVTPGTPSSSGNCSKPTSTGILSTADWFGYVVCLMTSKSLWIRVGEGAVALILLDVGLKSLTGTSVIETAGKQAKRAGKTAAMVAK